MTFETSLKQLLIFLISLMNEIYLMVKQVLSKEKTISINGMSCSFPKNCYTQSDMQEMFIKNYCGGKENLLKEDFDFIHRVFAAALIERSYVNLEKQDLFSRMKREDYTAYVKQTMIALSIESTLNALKDSHCYQLKDITHLIVGTMTGTIDAPSIDILIAKELQLNANVKRLNVQSMGCLTGFRLVGLARDIANQSSANLILLIVCDIRSALGNQLTPFLSKKSIDKSNVIISALFRDSCSATLISQRKPVDRPFAIMDHHSFIIPETIHLGRLKEFNDGSIHLYLDKQLPYAVFNALPNFLSNLLHEHRIDINQCQFAVHTGGPKILRGIEECLNLKEEQLCSSWFVMINYGNLSGSSNMVVVEHLRKWKYSNDERPFQNQIKYPKDFHQYQYLIGLSFGPGIAVECILFRLF